MRQVQHSADPLVLERVDHFFDFDRLCKEVRNVMPYCLPRGFVYRLPSWNNNTGKKHFSRIGWSSARIKLRRRQWMLKFMGRRAIPRNQVDESGQAEAKRFN